MFMEMKSHELPHSLIGWGFLTYRLSMICPDFFPFEVSRVDEEEIRGFVSIWPLKLLNAVAVAVALRWIAPILSHQRAGG